MQTAAISEIFVSIQGEGLSVGDREIFLRLAGCNLECVYCDTDSSIPPYASIYYPDILEPVKLVNPLSSSNVLQIILDLITQEGLSLPIAVTGGEPLLRSKFLKELFPPLKAKKLKILLETNGVLPQNLKDVVSFLDCLSMDLKLPSQVKGVSYLSIQKEFLEIAFSIPELFLKIIVTPEAAYEELEKALEITKGLNPLPPLVLQPVTTEKKLGVASEKLMEWQKRLAQNFPQVLIIPQTHIFLGIK